MLSPDAKISELNAQQWRRLTELVYSQGLQRVFLLHEGGSPVRLWDTKIGDLALPTEAVTDPQATADALHARYSEAFEAWVLDPEAFAKKMSEAQTGSRFDMDLDVYSLFEFDHKAEAAGHAVSPKRDLIWHGVPLRRIQKFVDKMLPPACVYVLGVFDGDQLWASLLVEFEGKKIVSITTSDALAAEDVKDVVGRDQHPYFLSVAANFFRKPAFGWFVERPVFEAYMRAQDIESKDEIFQKAIMGNQATFDFNILVDRTITAFSPINPGEAAIQGQDRESNPRTQTPDPDDPGPSAL